MGRIFKWIGIVFIALISMAVVGCTTIVLPRVSVQPDNFPAEPDVLSLDGERITSKEAWEASGKPYWQRILLSQVYGSVPPALPVNVISEEVLNDQFLGGKAVLRVIKLKIGDDLYLDVHSVTPNKAGPHPIVLGAGFCPNHAVLPFEGVEPPEAIYPGFCDGSWLDPLVSFVLGRHINTPPLEDIIDAGFGFAAYFPGQIVPDSTSSAPAALAKIPTQDLDNGPYSALGVWAWSASRIVDYFATSEVYNADQVILFGHSRYGKAALLAGVLDERIAGVISHQSGTGGASLQKNDVGESIEEITSSYPHWFSSNYASFAGREGDMPFDQHALVALMAPRPLLLGNSGRDQWSDPQGAFDAANAASKVYELYGLPAFAAKNLKDFDANALLSYQFRPGTHGIVPEDWAPFIDWLEVHFKAE